MLVGNFTASWNHKTQIGNITLVGINPPSFAPTTQIIENVNASEMAAVLAILRSAEPIEYSGATGVLKMKNPKVISVT
jgi:hypothetical protein